MPSRGTARLHPVLLDGLHGVFEDRNCEDYVWLGRLGLSVRAEVQHDGHGRYDRSPTKNPYETGLVFICFLHVVLRHGLRGEADFGLQRWLSQCSAGYIEAIFR